MGKVVHPKDKAEFDKLINGKKPVLVDFFATWCGPCQMMSPVIDEMGDEKNYADTDKVEIAKVNVDKVGEVAQEYGIMSVPTFGIFKEGKIKETLVGMRTEAELKAKLSAELKK